MNTRSLIVSGSVVAAMAVTSTASAWDLHVSGSDWGVWVTGIQGFFENLSTNPDGSSHVAVTDNTAGAAMDFMMTLPDGSVIDGRDTTSRMVTADFFGEVGDSSLQLTDWSVWVEGFGIGVHVHYTSSATANLIETNADGTFDYAADLAGVAHVEVLRADGSVETFDRGVGTFEFNGIPSPGAAALFGLAGLTTARRRR